jgi:hypothetical protein
LHIKWLYRFAYKKPNATGFVYDSTTAPTNTVDIGFLLYPGFWLPKFRHQIFFHRF